MPRLNRIVPLIVILSLLAPSLATGAQDDAAKSPRKITRWESDLSIGTVSNDRLGIVKSIWWFPVPKIVAIGLSIDYVAEVMPFSLNVAVNAPTPYVVPFVCAGAGTSLTTGGITHYGGGIKIRLGRRFGLIAEYRTYRYKRNVSGNPPLYETSTAAFFGGGIAWIY